MQNNVAKEYSEALFILACEEKKEKEYLDELKLTESLISENPEYMLLLSSPNVQTEEKLSVLENTFSNHLSESVMSFLLLLCEKGRITDLKLIFLWPPHLKLQVQYSMSYLGNKMTFKFLVTVFVSHSYC